MRFDISSMGITVLHKCALAVARIQYITAWPLRQATTLALFELFTLLFWDTTLAHGKYTYWARYGRTGTIILRPLCRTLFCGVC